MHLEPDGTPSASGSLAPFGPNVETTQLAIAGSEVRMGVWDFGSTVEPKYVPLTTAGAIAGPIVSIDAFANTNAFPGLAVMGTDTLIAANRNHSDVPSRVEFVRVDSAGAPVHAVRTIATGPDWFETAQIVRCGPSAIVAWINGRPFRDIVGLGTAGIGLAKIAP